jgi:hypothetical protein
VAAAQERKVQVVDEHGVFHTEKEALTIDTNLYNVGVTQRVEAHIMMPFIKKKLLDLDDKRAKVLYA